MLKNIEIRNQGRNTVKKKYNRGTKPGVDKTKHPKIRHEYIDPDYFNKLIPEHQAYLSEFYDEYYGANLDFDNLENNRFHTTEKLKKDCTDRVNASNRCIYGRAKARGEVTDPPDFTEED